MPRPVDWNCLPMLYSNHPSKTPKPFLGLNFNLCTNHTQWATLHTFPASDDLAPSWYPLHVSFLASFSCPPTPKYRHLQGFAFALRVFSLNYLFDFSHLDQIIPRILSSPRFDPSIELKLLNSFWMMLIATNEKSNCVPPLKMTSAFILSSVHCFLSYLFKLETLDHLIPFCPPDIVGLKASKLYICNVSHIYLSFLLFLLRPPKFWHCNLSLVQLH